MVLLRLPFPPSTNRLTRHGVRGGKMDMGAGDGLYDPGVPGRSLEDQSRYVPWAEVQDYLNIGWVIGKPASDYSAFMWACPSCNADGKKVPQWNRTTR